MRNGCHPRHCPANPYFDFCRSTRPEARRQISLERGLRRRSPCDPTLLRSTGGNDVKGGALSLLGSALASSAGVDSLHVDHRLAPASRGLWEVEAGTASPTRCAHESPINSINRDGLNYQEKDLAAAAHTPSMKQLGAEQALACAAYRAAG